MSKDLRYRPEVDGLRALAVLPVILFHGDIAPLPGGFAGVDVFFVISGFLITGILMQDLALGRHSLARFYERRVRRIVPALIVVLAATSALAWLLSDPVQLQAYSQSLLSVVLMVSNLFFGAKSGYFAPALADAPLLHTWSLTVEEQFYLAFPPLLVLLWRLSPPRRLAVLVGLCLASLALAEWGLRAGQDMAYFFPLTRAWELGLGAIAAHVSLYHRPRPRPWLAALGLGMILASYVLHSKDSAYPGLPALLPTLGAALVLLHAQAGHGVGLVLAARPVVGIGLVSYSAYLWHQPLFALARSSRTDPPGWAMMAGLGLLTLVLAWATWALVEQPFRRAQNRWLPRRGPLLGAALAASLCLAGVAGLGWASQGNLSAWSARNPDQAAMLALITQAGQADGPPADAQGCRFNLGRIDQTAQSRIADCAARFGPAAVVLGDSHGIDLFNALAASSPAPFLLGVTAGGCRPSQPGPACAFDDFAALVAAQPQLFSHILFTQAGATLFLDQGGRPTDRQLFRKLPAHAAVPPLPPDQPGLDRLAAYLRGLAAHVPVTVLSPWIEPHVPPNLVLRAGCKARYALRPGQAEAFQALDAALARTLQDSGIALVPLAAQGFDMGQDFLTCDTLYWSDGDHWSPSGEARFGARLLPLLPPAFR